MPMRLIDDLLDSDETDKTKHQFLSQTVKKKIILKMGEGLVPKLHKLNIKEANWMKHT